MTAPTLADALLPCPFCGDDGDKGIQTVTQMAYGRPTFDRITCRACGAMCPQPNWNRRASLPQAHAPAVPDHFPDVTKMVAPAVQMDAEALIDELGKHAAAVRLAESLGFAWRGGEWVSPAVQPSADSLRADAIDALIRNGGGSLQCAHPAGWVSITITVQALGCTGSD